MGKTEKQKKKPAASTAVQTPRKLKKPSYKSFRVQKRIKGDRLPGAFRLFWRALVFAGRNWKLFLGIVVVYGVLNALLVQGFRAAGNFSEIKSSLDAVFQGDMGGLAAGITAFAYLLGASGNGGNPTAGAYQLFLTLLISLAMIWALRQLYAGHKIRVRDSFYSGMSPLVKFVLVLVVIGLQLIPMTIGIFLYSVVMGAGIAATGIEQVLWAAFAFVLSVISLYMASSSIFALYIVTLPEMTPMRALRSARQLAVNRRWAVMRKVLFLPAALVVLAALVIVPIILFATPLAAWAFFLLSLLILPIAHSYMYALYRAML